MDTIIPSSNDVDKDRETYLKSFLQEITCGNTVNLDIEMNETLPYVQSNEDTIRNYYKKRTISVQISNLIRSDTQDTRQDVYTILKCMDSVERIDSLRFYNCEKTSALFTEVAKLLVLKKIGNLEISHCDMDYGILTPVIRDSGLESIRLIIIGKNDIVSDDMCKSIGTCPTIRYVYINGVGINPNNAQLLVDSIDHPCNATLINYKHLTDKCGIEVHVGVNKNIVQFSSCGNLVNAFTKLSDQWKVAQYKEGFVCTRVPADDQPSPTKRQKTE